MYLAYPYLSNSTTLYADIETRRISEGLNYSWDQTHKCAFACRYCYERSWRRKIDNANPRLKPPYIELQEGETRQISWMGRNSTILYNIFMFASVLLLTYNFTHVHVHTYLLISFLKIKKNYISLLICLEDVCLFLEMPLEMPLIDITFMLM